jgi:hypothetical protein
MPRWFAGVGGDVTLIENTTFSANVGRPDRRAAGGGSAAASTQGDVATFRHNTLAENQVVGPAGVTLTVGGGLGVAAATSVTAVANLLAANEALPASGGVVADYCGSLGTITSAGYNLVGASPAGAPCTTFTAVHDQVGVASAKLLGAADNGCVEQLPDKTCVATVMLLSGSPAIDAGSCTGAAVTDSRGVSRPIDITGVANADDACDIGALEPSRESSEDLQQRLRALARRRVGLPGSSRPALPRTDRARRARSR